MRRLKGSLWKNVTERGAPAFSNPSAFGLWAVCGIWCGLNLTWKRCCDSHQPGPPEVLAPLFPFFALYTRNLCFLGSTPHRLEAGFGQWEALAGDGGPEPGKGRLPFSTSSPWTALLVMAESPLWFQRRPDTPSMTSASVCWCCLNPGLWNPGILPAR